MLVDNTRSDRLGSPDFWHALKCIRCGACMNTCPVYRRGGGLSYGATYSGPIGVILDPGFDLSKYRELPFHSSLCGSCTQVCPVKIDISDQIYKWRRVVAARGLLRLSKRVGMSALGTALSHPTLFHSRGIGWRGGPGTLAALPALQPAQPVGQAPRAAGRSKQTFRQWYLEEPEESMKPRDAILAAVRRNLPRPAVPLPEVPASNRKGLKTGFGYKEHFDRLPEVPGFPEEGEPILPYFRRQLEAMGGGALRCRTPRPPAPRWPSCSRR